MALLSATFPIFILAAIGFAIARRGLYSATDFNTLARFVVMLALPALLFRTMADLPVRDVFEPGYVMAYLGGTLLVVALGYGGWRLVGRATGDVAAMRTMGMACPNSGFVGYPLMLLTFPEIAGKVLALNMAVENLVIIPLLLALAEGGRHAGAGVVATMRTVLRELVRNPMIVGLASGFIWSLAGLPLPAIVRHPVDMLAAASGAVSLIVIGGMLAGTRICSWGWPVVVTIAGKLLLQPMAIIVMMLVVTAAGFPISDPELARALTISGAFSVMGIYPLLALRYGQAETASVVLAGSTILSFITLNLVVLFAEALIW
ncbi:MAG: AEC family transporter [Nitratireductor sp.]